MSEKITNVKQYIEYKEMQTIDTTARRPGADRHQIGTY